MISSVIGGGAFWIGVIENRIDPLKVGRVQVRIAGAHTSNKTIIPTESLPWAQCLMPINDAASPTFKEGDYVLGIYLDGDESQQPLILGLLPGIPDRLLPLQEGFSDPRTTGQLTNAPRPPASLGILSTGTNVSIKESPTALRNPSVLNEPTTSRLARNENTEQTLIQAKKDSVFKSIPIPGNKTYDEPPTPYNASYPYNRVMETESGHVVEFDDTPGSERIHIYHRSGSFEEYHPDGSKVSKINADSFEIVLSDKCIYINGDCNITAKRNINLKSGEDCNIEVGGDLNIKATKAIKMQAAESLTAWTVGPLALQGLPLNLNGGIPPPLGPPTGPMVFVSGATVTVTNVIVPNPTDPGNVVLSQRPGANVSDKPPNEISVPSATPEGIPVPPETNTAPVETLTTTEGADVMVRGLNRAKISDPLQRAMIYAQAAHESNGFKTLFESFKYTDQGLIKTWPKYFNANNVSQYVRQPEKIANRVYANRMGNGDEASGDGFKYRGRGFIQLTGKANYVAASLSLNEDFINFPDAAAVPDTAADLAVWFFAKGKGTGYKGKYNDIVAATKFVNGGLNGLDDRTQRFQLAQANTQVTTLTAIT